MTTSRVFPLLALLAIALIMAAPVLGFMHAAVPHTHVHAQTLHSDLHDGLFAAISRQDLLIAALPAFSLFVFELIALLTLAPVIRTGRLDYAQLDALRRGRVPYRTFG